MTLKPIGPGAGLTRRQTDTSNTRRTTSPQPSRLPVRIASPAGPSGQIASRIAGNVGQGTTPRAAQVNVRAAPENPSVLQVSRLPVRTAGSSEPARHIASRIRGQGSQSSRLPQATRSTVDTGSQSTCGMTSQATQTPPQPLMVDASTQTGDQGVRLPTEILFNVTGHLAEDASKRVGSTPQDRRTLANMTQLDRHSRAILRPEVEAVRLERATRKFNIRTAAQVQALLGTSAATDGTVMSIRLPASRERPLANLLDRAAGMPDNERQAALPLLLNAIATLPPQNAANTLEQAVRVVPDSVRAILLGTPATPGTILNLSAHLQPQPLEAMVDAYWTNMAPGNASRVQLATIVQGLPKGVGVELKQRVVNP